MNTPLLLVNDLEVKMNTPVWRGLAQTGVFNSIKICVISHERNTKCGSINTFLFDSLIFNKRMTAIVIRLLIL